MSRSRTLSGRILLASWLVPAIAAALWAAITVLTASEPLATVRSLTFAVGPLVLLAGLHARLYPFLHAPQRSRTLHLPVDARAHWRAAIRLHGPPLAVSAALGALALGLGGSTAVGPRGLGVGVGLAFEFLYLAVFAGLLEPVASAVASALGRRFPEQSPVHELQRSLGGGWTTPEAVVHLYAPAACVGAAALLAMPGQLSFERWFDGRPLSPAYLAWVVVPLGLALAARFGAAKLYGVGFWQAIPWLVEATRTLAGPPRPESTPVIARWIPSPHARLIAIEFWRTTPLPGLRLALIVGLIAHAIVRPAGVVTGPHAAIMAAAAAAWLVPAGGLARTRRARAQLCGALPLASGARRGGLGVLGASLLTLPVLGLVIAVALVALS